MPLSGENAPSQRSMLLGLAIAAIEADRPDDAQAPCRTLLATQPDDADAMLLHGLALGLAGDVARAAATFNAVRRARPDHAHPCHTLTALLDRHGRPAAARAHEDAALAAALDDDALRLALADRRHEAGEAHVALDLLAPLLARADCPVQARVLAGVALGELGQIARAMAQFRLATDMAPRNAAAWSNLGMLLKVEGRFEEAVKASNRAVALAPQAPQIRLNRAVTLLRAGRMADAWDDYECRLRLPGRNRLPIERMLPPLSTVPGAMLADRTVLLTHEEGFGDSLQFMRYAPLLAKRGMRVLAWMPAPLARLMAEVPGLERVIVAGEPVPETDYHCPVFSLPRIFETTLDTIPPPLAYRVPATLVRHWAARLPQSDACRRVGLVWAGQARPWLPGFSVLDGRRSLSLSALAPLANVAGVRLFSLQTGTPAAELARCPPGLALHDPTGGIADFADTAAIVQNLDIVVSADTAIVHLAASMGKPVLLLDRYDNCWRWLAGRDDSPWYPSLRIVRQTVFGDWTDPIARVARALSDLAA